MMSDVMIRMYNEIKHSTKSNISKMKFIKRYELSTSVLFKN